LSTTAPGWYPDPDPNAPAGRQRWHSGAGWTEHVGAPQEPVAVTAAPAGLGFPVASAYPVQGTAGYGGYPAYGTPAPVQQWASQTRIAVGSMSKREFKRLPRKVRYDYGRTDLDLAIGKNRAGSYAMVLGILSCVLINPFCVVSITAIVRGAQGRRHAQMWAASGYPPLGQSESTAGFVMGIVGTCIWVVFVAAQLLS
jgi:hypothetical protein